MSSPTMFRTPGWTATAGFGGVGLLAALALLRPEAAPLTLAALLAAAAAACAPALACARAALSPSATPDEAVGARDIPAQPARGPSAAEAPAPRSRRHVRIALRDARTVILTEDRRRLLAQVIDVSRSGVALEGNLPGLWIGSMVTVGSRRAKAVRTLPNGMAFEFSAPIPPQDLRPDLVL